MKVAFIHDFHAFKNQNNFYSTGFPYKIWERYLTTFDELLIISRIKEREDKSSSLSSGKNVSFHPVREYQSMGSLIKNYKSIRTHIESIINEADGVIIRLPSVLGFIAADICVKKQKKYCVEVVGSAFYAFWYHSLIGKSIAILMEKAQERAVKKSSVAIYITESYLQKSYPSYGKMFGKVSNVTINDNKDDYLIKNDDNYFRVGLVGSTFVEYKGHKTALNAIKILRNEGHKIKLSLVGQGLSRTLKEKITQLGLDDNVEFLGVIDGRNEMNSWYRGLDCYIQPSLTEGHGRSVVEAIDNGIPTIASNVGGLPDSVDKEYLFEHKNHCELANLIRNIIIDSEFSHENIQKNTERIQKYQEQIVEKRRIEALGTYKQLIEEN